MSLALLFHYLMLNMFRMLVHPSSGACNLFVVLFHVLYCSGSMCVGVTMWYPYTGWSTASTPPQPNHNVTPIHIELEQYNTWNKSTISRKLLKIDVLTLETCWAVNSEIIKQMTSSWYIFIELSRWCTVQWTKDNLHFIRCQWRRFLIKRNSTYLKLSNDTVQNCTYYSQQLYVTLNQDRKRR